MSEMTREQGHAHCIELLSSGDPAYKPRVLARQFLTHYDGRRPSDEAVARLAAEWMAEIKSAATEQPVAYKNPPWWDGNPATLPVRCTDCALYRGTAGWCAAAGKVAGFSHWRRCGAFRAAEGQAERQALRGEANARRAEAAKGEIKVYRGERYNAEKASHGGWDRVERPRDQNELLEKTADRLAKEFDTSPATIKRDAKPLSTIRAALADADLLRFVLELRDTDEGRSLRLTHGIPERERFELYRVAGLKVLENDPAIVGRASKGHRKHGGRADESDPSQHKSRAA